MRGFLCTGNKTYGSIRAVLFQCRQHSIEGLNIWARRSRDRRVFLKRVFVSSLPCGKISPCFPKTRMDRDNSKFLWLLRVDARLISQFDPFRFSIPIGDLLLSQGGSAFQHQTIGPDLMAE